MHPDLVDEAQKGDATFQILGTVYAVLSDKEKRASNGQGLCWAEPRPGLRGKLEVTVYKDISRGHSNF